MNYLQFFAVLSFLCTWSYAFDDELSNEMSFADACELLNPQNCNVARLPLGLEKNPSRCLIDGTNSCVENNFCQAISTKDFCARFVYASRGNRPVFRIPSAQECIGSVSTPSPNPLRANLCRWEMSTRKCLPKNGAAELHAIYPKRGNTKPLGQICAEAPSLDECFNFSSSAVTIPGLNDEVDSYFESQRSLFCAPTLNKSRNMLPLPDDVLNQYQHCDTDDDCIYVNNGCCDCANGGFESCIRREFLGHYYNHFSCSNVICTGIGRDPPCGTGTPRCRNNKCFFEQGN